MVTLQLLASPLFPLTRNLQALGLRKMGAVRWEKCRQMGFRQPQVVTMVVWVLILLVGSKIITLGTECTRVTLL